MQRGEGFCEVGFPRKGFRQRRVTLVVEGNGQVQGAAGQRCEGARKGGGKELRRTGDSEL